MKQRWSILALRVGVPALISLCGVVLTVAGGSDELVGIGVTLIGVGLLVAFLNALLRLGLQSERDREREERAREYYDRHGRWPGRDWEDRSG